MSVKTRYLIGGGLLAVFLFLSAWVQAAEFTAQVFTKSQGQEKVGKIVVQDKKVRREFPSARGLQVAIVNPEKKMVFILFPDSKMYLEMPFTEEAGGDLMQAVKDKGQMKSLGTEQVSGYETEKFETVMKANGDEVKHFMWVAKKLGTPIKITSPDQSFVMEYRDIKEEKADAAMFELPAGYQKMSQAPGMPKGRPGTK